MVVTRRFETGSGSGVGISGQYRSGLTEDRVREIIRQEVVSIVRRQILELFGSIKTSMMEFFDDRYATLLETATAIATIIIVVAVIGIGRAFQYQDFDNMKHLVFDGV